MSADAQNFHYGLFFTNLLVNHANMLCKAGEEISCTLSYWIGWMVVLCRALISSTRQELHIDITRGKLISTFPFEKERMSPQLKFFSDEFAGYK